MTLVEKKYRVQGFEQIEKFLKKAGVKVVKHVTSTHYYGEHEGNDVEKFVVYPDRVDMNYVEYAYKQGLVGLYVIDNFLFSVILNFLEGQHEQIEKDFGLETAEVVRLPYNKYLASLGRRCTYNIKVCGWHSRQTKKRS